jgi:hypothetical protein
MNDKLSSSIHRYRVVNRIRQSTALLAFLFSCSTKAASIETCQGLKFERVHHVSVQDLGRLTQPQIASGKPGAVVFIPFDEEDHPSQGKFRALRLIFARTGNLGETPVGGYVWISKDAAASSPAVTSDDQAVSTTFRTGDKQHCTTSQLTFALKQAGKTYVNGSFVATVK